MRASAAAGAADPPQGDAGSGQQEPVDYRLYQALMRGGEEVISILKEMTELVSAFLLPISLSLSIALLVLGIWSVDVHFENSEVDGFRSNYHNCLLRCGHVVIHSLNSRVLEETNNCVEN